MLNRTALIVEDDRATCHALRGLLEGDGLETECVHTLADAVIALPRLRPDFVLLDLTLPDGDSARLIDIIRGEPRPARIAVMTASADRPAIDRVHIVHADVVFVKPMTAGPLLQWIANHAPAALGESRASVLPPF
jgi:two-component system response regulator MtrA